MSEHTCSVHADLIWDKELESLSLGRGNTSSKTRCGCAQVGPLLSPFCSTERKFLPEEHALIFSAHENELSLWNAGGKRQTAVGTRIGSSLIPSGTVCILANCLFAVFWRHRGVDLQTSLLSVLRMRGHFALGQSLSVSEKCLEKSCLLHCLHIESGSSLHG